MALKERQAKKNGLVKKKLYKTEDRIILLPAKDLLAKRADIETYFESKGFGQGWDKVNIT